MELPKLLASGIGGNNLIDCGILNFYSLDLRKKSKGENVTMAPTSTKPRSKLRQVAEKQMVLKTPGLWKWTAVSSKCRKQNERDKGWRAGGRIDSLFISWLTSHSWLLIRDFSFRDWMNHRSEKNEKHEWIRDSWDLVGQSCQNVNHRLNNRLNVRPLSSS